MQKFLYFAIIPFFLLFANQVLAGGGPVEFTVSPNSPLYPGKEYIVHALVHDDGPYPTYCKNCEITLKLQNPQENDFIEQNNTRTDENGRVYARVISKISGQRALYTSNITRPDGITYVSNSSVVLNYVNLWTTPVQPTSVIINPTGGPIRTTDPIPLERNKISWVTNKAYLEADNFHIKIDGKKYLGNSNVNLHSDSSGGPYTTLEATWSENGTEMRLYMYFIYTPGKFWKLNEIRTYNGQVPGDWIFYNPVDSNGQNIQNVLGQPYINYASPMDFYPKEGSKYSGLIHFENIKLLAFAGNTIINTGQIKIAPPTSIAVSGEKMQTSEVNKETEELNRKVEELQKQLDESKQKQSALEQTVNNLLNFIRSVFPFFKP